MHTSQGQNLSPQKTAVESLRDPTWICVFCKHPPHFDELGDLFGPYFIPKETGSPSKGTPGRKRKNTMDSTSSGGRGRSSSTSMSDKNCQEVWFHQDCICWSSGVYLIGKDIRNMDEVVRESSSRICSSCEVTGANLGCVFPGCLMTFHFGCAKRSRCVFSEDNYSILCEKHKVSISVGNFESKFNTNSLFFFYDSTGQVSKIRDRSNDFLFPPVFTVT